MVNFNVAMSNALIKSFFVMINQIALMGEYILDTVQDFLIKLGNCNVAMANALIKSFFVMINQIALMGEYIVLVETVQDLNFMFLVIQNGV